MQWWNEFVDWLSSDDGWRILSSVVFPLLAIIAAGFIAAMIGRGSTRRLLAHHDREQRVSTVASLIGAARRASKWNTLSGPEREHADHLAHDADVSVRLLPLGGSSMTADWAAHEIAEMKKNSVSFSFQAEQSLMDFRDRLVEWQSRPSRAKKLFKADLDLWAYESSQEDKGLVEKQQEWAKQQVATETGPMATVTPTVTAAATATATPAVTATVAPELKPISWGTPASVASPTPPATPAVAPFVPAAHAMAAAPAHASASDLATPVTPDSGELLPLDTPTPVSAQTVRQRILPDYEDDLR